MHDDVALCVHVRRVCEFYTAPQGLAVESGIARLMDMPVVTPLKAVLPPQMTALLSSVDDPVRGLSTSGVVGCWGVGWCLRGVVFMFCHVAVVWRVGCTLLLAGPFQEHDQAGKCHLPNVGHPWRVRLHLATATGPGYS